MTIARTVVESMARRGYAPSADVAKAVGCTAVQMLNLIKRGAIQSYRPEHREREVWVSVASAIERWNDVPEIVARLRDLVSANGVSV